MALNKVDTILNTTDASPTYPAVLTLVTLGLTIITSLGFIEW